MTSIKRVLVAICAAVMVSLSGMPFNVAHAVDYQWKYTTWGRAWIGFRLDIPGHRVYGEVQDIKTDGYCVEVRLRRADEVWPGIRAAISCGPIASFNVDNLQPYDMYAQIAGP